MLLAYVASCHLQPFLLLIFNVTIPLSLIFLIQVLQLEQGFYGLLEIVQQIQLPRTQIQHISIRIQDITLLL